LRLCASDLLIDFIRVDCYRIALIGVDCYRTAFDWSRLLKNNI